jgi:hypothetical protein
MNGYRMGPRREDLSPELRSFTAGDYVILYSIENDGEVLGNGQRHSKLFRNVKPMNGQLLPAPLQGRAPRSDSDPSVRDVIHATPLASVLRSGGPARTVAVA